MWYWKMKWWNLSSRIDRVMRRFNRLYAWGDPASGELVSGRGHFGSSCCLLESVRVIALRGFLQRYFLVMYNRQSHTRKTMTWRSQVTDWLVFLRANELRRLSLSLSLALSLSLFLSRGCCLVTSPLKSRPRSYLYHFTIVYLVHGDTRDIPF